MEAFLMSALLVALAEMGDRTQLLAIMLAGRYRRPLPILLGILVATLANHALAALAGASSSSALSGISAQTAIAINDRASAYLNQRACSRLAR